MPAQLIQAKQIQSNVAPANVTNSAAVTGTSVALARADHKHDVDSATGVTIGATNAEGSSTSLALADHTHQVSNLNFTSEAIGTILYFNGSVWVILANGTDDQILTAHTAGAPTWEDNVGGGTPTKDDITTETVSGTDTALADAVSPLPLSLAGFTLYLNGVQQEEGAGRDYSLVIGTGVITWLASTGTAVDLATSDVLNAVYFS